MGWKTGILESWLVGGAAGQGCGAKVERLSLDGPEALDGTDAPYLVMSVGTDEGPLPKNSRPGLTPLSKLCLH